MFRQNWGRKREGIVSQFSLGFLAHIMLVVTMLETEKERDCIGLISSRSFRPDQGHVFFH